ncbi:MAG TPA: hypothetical protein VMU03_02930 [Gammaproteobacteria bacterium]|jgi:hypothetical protein|nr:hypothetical protein [Gammaproteobacteria bacterium]
MNPFRFPSFRFAARVSTGLAALLAFHSALALDEYVVYGKRAPLIPAVDRAALRGELEQRATPGADGALVDSVRAALADALRAARAPSDLRFASADQRPRA